MRRGTGGLSSSTEARGAGARRAIATVAALLPLAMAMVAVGPAAAGASPGRAHRHPPPPLPAARRYRPAMQPGHNLPHFGDPQLGGTHTISEDVAGPGSGASSNVSQTPVAAVRFGNTEYVGDSSLDVVRALDLTTGQETAYAGNGGQGFDGDGGPATQAQLGQPTALALDSLGNLYVEVESATAGSALRIVPAVGGTHFGTAMTAGDIYTIGYFGASGLAVDAAGNVAMAGDGQLLIVAATSGTFYGVAMTEGSIYAVGSASDRTESVSVGSAGSLVLGTSNGTLLQLAADGTETLLAGGTGTGPATMLAQAPAGLATTAGSVELYDGAFSTIRTVDLASGYESQLGGSAATGLSGDYSDWGFDAATDGDGNLYFPSLLMGSVDDTTIYMVPATSGTYYGVSMTAGDAYAIYSLSTAGWPIPPCSEIQTYYPGQLTADPSGDLFWVDASSNQLCEAKDSNGFLQSPRVLETLGGNTAEVAANAYGLVVGEPAGVFFMPFTDGAYFDETMTAYGVYPVAGDGTSGDTGDDGPAGLAEVDAAAVTIDSQDDIFELDAAGHSVREIPSGPGSSFGQSMNVGDIYDVAGDGASGTPSTGSVATQSPLDATASAGLTAGPSGTLYFADGTQVFQVSAANDVLTLVAGNGGTSLSSSGLPGPDGQLQATDVQVDASGNVVAAGPAGLSVYAVDSGTDYGIGMSAGDLYTVPTPSWSGWPLAVDGAGDVFSATGQATSPDGYNRQLSVFVASPSSWLGQAEPAGATVVLAGNDLLQHSGDGAAAADAEIDATTPAVPLCGVGSNGLGRRGAARLPATEATSGVGSCALPAGGTAVDTAGDVAIADGGNDAVRFVPASSGTYFGIAMTAGDVYTIAGGGTAGPPSAGGTPSLAATLSSPTDVAFDVYGNLYVSDTGNGRVETMPVSATTPFGTGLTVGDIYTIAGGGSSTADGVAGTADVLGTPAGLGVDASGDVVFSDPKNGTVRLLAATSGTRFGQSLTAGDVYTIAGLPQVGDESSTGNATSIALNLPTGLATDLNDDVFVAATGQNQVLVLTVAGNLELLAGDGTGGDYPTGTTQVPAAQAQLDEPTGLAVDWAGDVFVSDEGNEVVREVDVAGNIATVAGDGTAGLSGDGGAATSAELATPAWLSIDGGGDLLLTDSGNQRVRIVQGVAASGPEAGPCGGPETYGSGASPDAACMAATESHLLGPDSGSVSTLNGEYSLEYPLFSIPNRGGKLTVALDYNSANAGTSGPAGAVGNGFSLEPLGSLYVAPGTGDVTVNAGDGSAVTFEPEPQSQICPTGYVGNGSYCAPDRVEATLTEPSSGQYVEVLNRVVTDTYALASGSTTSGELLSSTDLEGDSTSYSYNSSQQLTTITDAGGRQISLTWNAGGQVATITDPLSREYQLSYTGNDLASVTDTLGRVTSFGYNSAGELSSVTPPNGQLGGPDAGSSTAITYTNGEVTSATDPAGRETTFAYVGSSSTLFGGTTTVTDPAGYTTLDVFHLGELVATTSGVGTQYAATTHFAYDPVTTLLSAVRDPDGYSTSYTWDGQGDLLQRVDQNRNVTTYTYDQLGDTLTVEDPLGNVTTDTYDANGDILTSSTLLGSGVSAVTKYKYGNSNHPGEVTAETDPDGYTTDYVYDVYGDVNSVTDPMGGVTKRNYNKDGQLLNSTDPMLLETKWVYDRDGEVTTLTDPAGGVTTYTYDADGNKLTVTDPMSRKTSYTYDADDEVVTKTDPIGHVTTYGYDGDGNQTSVEDPSLKTTRTAYGPDGLVLSATDALGASTTYAYDEDGRKIRSTDPSGNVTLFGYTPDGKLASETAPDGGVTRYTYDADDQLLSEQAPLGGVQSYTYDAGGRKATSTTADQYTTSYTYDPAGNLLTTTYPMGEVTSRTYDKDGRVASVADRGGDETTYTYDADGRVASTTPPDGNASSNPAAYATTYTYDSLGNTLTATVGTGATARTTTYGYDADSERTTVETPRSETTTTKYDADGRVTQVTDPLGLVTKYSYNVDSRKVSTTNPDGGVTKWTYDADGHVLTVTDPDTHQVTYAYYENGWLETSQDGDGNVTTYTYFPTGKTKSVTNGAGDETQYTYDLDQRVATMTNPSGGVYTFGYDADGNVTSLQDPLSRTTSHSYDGDDRLQTTTDPQSRVATYSYDGNGRLSVIGYSDGVTPNVGYTYDPSGRRLKLTDGTGTTTYGYDSFGELTSYQDGAGSTVSYGYDADGDVTTITYPGAQVVTYGYDADARLQTVTDWLGQVSTYTYNGDGAVTGLTMGGSGDSVATVRDADDNASSVTLQASGGTNLLALANTFDGNSNLTAQAATGAISSNTTYAYDKASRIVGQGSTSPPPSNTYTYWKAGFVSKLLGNVAQHFDAAGEVTSQTPPAPAPATTFGYDSLGERTSATSSTGTTTYAWNQADSLTSLTTASATTTYTYDGDGLRMTSSTGGVTTAYAWDTTSTVPHLLTDGTNAYVYGLGDVPIEQVALGTSTASFLFEDQLGSVRAVVSSTGSVVATATYNAYGTVASGGVGASTPFGFAGGETDPTGLVYLVNRYYDPATAQFLTVDALVSTTDQPYEYGNDNPTDDTDPSGNMPCAGGRCGSLQYLEHPPVYTPAQIAALNREENLWAEQGKLETILSGSRTAMGAQFRVIQQEYFAEDNLAQEQQAQGGLRGLVADISAAVGDFLTLGAGSVLRNSLISGLGRLNPVNEQSAAYQITSDVVMVASIVNPIGDAADAAESAEEADNAAKAALDAGDAAKAATELQQASTDTAAAIDHLALAEKDVEEELGSVEEALTCGGQSFSATTLVVLADGRPVPISSVKPGQKVLATDPKTGKRRAETVQAVWVDRDTDLVDVVVRTGTGSQTISSTVHHLFYDLTTRRWTEAHALKPGDRLYTGDGRVATVVGTLAVAGAAVMWDLTVQNDHDFYVQLVAGAVLVHNCPAAGGVGPVNSRGAAYPQITDLKTGEPIPFPKDAPASPVPSEDRVPWGTGGERRNFIKQWYDNGYSSPPEDWSQYDIHHILPREFGGTNSFDNLTPVLRTDHPSLTNWWNNWGSGQ